MDIIGDESSTNLLGQHQRNQRAGNSSSHGQTKTEKTANKTYPPSSPHHRPRRYNATAYVRRLVTASWLWQLAALLCSFACTAVVAVVLFLESGTEVTKQVGGGLNIDINSIVSLIGGLSESLYMLVLAGIVTHLKWRHFRTPQRLSDIRLFDESTQSEVRSFKLLFTQYRDSLASLAAIIAILAFFGDFAFQQTLGFEIVAVQSSYDSAPSVNVSLLYDPNDYLMTDVDSNPGSAVNENMQSAILNALYSYQDPPLVECYADLCRWSRFTTLGVCSSCNDITQSTMRRCNADYPFQNETFSYTFCNYTVGGGVSLGALAERQLGNDLNYIQTLWNSTGSASALQRAQAVTPSSPQEAVLANFTSIKLEYPNDTAVQGYELPLTQALQCSIYLCNHTYVDVFVNTSDSTKPPSLPDPTNETLLITNRTSGIRSHPSNAIINTDSSYLSLSTSNSSTPSPNASLAINEADYLALGAYLAQLFTTAHDSNENDDRSGVSASGQVYSQDQITTPAIGRALYYLSDSPATIMNIAASMSETMRLDLNSTFARGEGTDDATVIKIKWVWLAFPLSLQVATSLLLAATYWVSRKEHGLRRREPELEILRNGLKGLPRDTVDDEALKRLMVKLEDGEGGLRLIKIA